MKDLTKECLDLIDYLNKIGILVDEIKEVKEVEDEC